MAIMGKYCKAYLLKQFRQFTQWNEQIENIRNENTQLDGKEVDFDRELPDNYILYLQENYLVTDGIFLDENIVFDCVTPEWKNFCANTLGFEVLVY